MASLLEAQPASTIARLLCSFSRCHRRAASSSGAPVQISELPRAGGGKTFTTWVKEPLSPTSSGVQAQIGETPHRDDLFLGLQFGLEGRHPGFVDLPDHGDQGREMRLHRVIAVVQEAFHREPPPSPKVSFRAQAT